MAAKKKRARRLRQNGEEIDYHSRSNPSNVEQPLGSKPLEAHGIPPFNSPVDIEVITYGSRWRDADGTSAKAAIDGIVLAGILRDDSHQWVKSVSYRFVKVAKASQEKTELILTEWQK